MKHVRLLPDCYRDLRKLRDEWSKKAGGRLSFSAVIRRLIEHWRVTR